MSNKLWACFIETVETPDFQIHEAEKLPVAIWVSMKDPSSFYLVGKTLFTAFKHQDGYKDGWGSIIVSFLSGGMPVPL